MAPIFEWWHELCLALCPLTFFVVYTVRGVRRFCFLLRATTLTAFEHSSFLTMTATAAATKVVPKFRYLSAWFCPFAHRATLALEHHAGRVEYEWVEVGFSLLLSD